MHMQMPRMPGSAGEQWTAPYVRTWHGDGTRLVMWHIWPMIGAAWLIFMCGAMMGAKSVMMKRRMMMMGGGMGGPMGGPPWMHKGMHGGMGMGGPGMYGKPMGMHGRMGMHTGGAPMWGMGHHHHHGHGTAPCWCGEEKAEEGTAQPEE